jgi:predicted CoA-binding protein
MISNPDDAQIARLLEETRVIALVGASPKPHRDSHKVMALLQRAGYRVIPVHPGLEGQTLLGEPVMARLEDIAVPVDLVDVFRRSDAVGPIADSAIAIGAKAIWMQLGVVNEEAAAKARVAGLTVVMDRCPAIEMPRLGIRGPAPAA